MEVRPYRPQHDYRMVLGAQCDLYQINFPRFVCTPAFLADQAQRLRAAGRRPFENGIFVLEDGDEFVGFVWVAIRMDLQGTFGSIDQVYVREPYRRQGLGRLLMAAAHKFVRQQGLSVARLYVTADNQDAVRLYQREGYQITRYEMEKPTS
jgi:ribosomal protein S18 acetylase RimI-like enzyme